ncbi:MAG: immunogenic protein [Clostridia bacterium]|nr:immunogenic protein [Clostridia bacterium]MBQ6938034.1 immunogenic protein [Clostridia bacterium]
MKKYICLILIVIFTVALAGCSKNGEKAQVIETITTDFKTYHKMSDGTYEFEGNIYKYRLEISGRMHNAAKNSTFIYLSNLENITFERAWKAAGLSSNTKDYFPVEDAVLVDWK